MTRVDVSTTRGKFAETLNQVAYGQERVVISRHGKDLAALITLDDLALLEAIEDRMDLEAAREALREPGTIPWEQVKAELGL